MTFTLFGRAHVLAIVKALCAVEFELALSDAPLDPDCGIAAPAIPPRAKAASRPATMMSLRIKTAS